MTRNSKSSSRCCGDPLRLTRRSLFPQRQPWDWDCWPARRVAGGARADPGAAGHAGAERLVLLQRTGGHGRKWRLASDGGVSLTIYPDGTMGGETDMVRRMRLGQLQAALADDLGPDGNRAGAGGLQFMPKAFRTLEEVDYIVQKLQPMLEKRLEAKGFVALFWTDTGLVRFFSKQPSDCARRSEEDQAVRLTPGAPRMWTFITRCACNPVPLEVGGHSAQLTDRPDQRRSPAAELRPGRTSGPGRAAHARFGWVPLVGARHRQQENLGCHSARKPGRPCARRRVEAGGTSRPTAGAKTWNRSKRCANAG